MQFTVYGVPKPGGSKKAFPIFKKNNQGIKHYSGMVVTDASKHVMEWRGAVVDAVRKVWTGDPMMGPLKMTIKFVMPRPKGHYHNTKKQPLEMLMLKPGAPDWHTSKPDATKLLRSTEDALNGILWMDDSQVVQVWLEKIYGRTPHADIEVNQI